MGKWATPHRFAKEFSRFVREAERSTLIIWSPSKKWHNNYIKSRLCSFPPNNDNHSTHIFVLIVIKKNTKDEKNNLYTRTTYRTYVQNTREIENNAELVFFSCENFHVMKCDVGFMETNSVSLKTEWLKFYAVSVHVFLFQIKIESKWNRNQCAFVFHLFCAFTQHHSVHSIGDGDGDGNRINIESELWIGISFYNRSYCLPFIYNLVHTAHQNVH